MYIYVNIIKIYIMQEENNYFKITMQHEEKTNC